MRAGMMYLRAGVFVSAIAFLAACAAGMPMDFGGNGCRTVYVLSGGVIQPVSTCGGVPREGLVAQKTPQFAAPAHGADLPAMLAAPKFEPDAYYSGEIAPADKDRLTRIVNDAVRDLISMTEPRGPMYVRLRLEEAIAALSGFAAADREQAHRYIVLAWRSVGFQMQSGLFPVPDEQVLDVP